MLFRTSLIHKTKLICFFSDLLPSGLLCWWEASTPTRNLSQEPASTFCSPHTSSSTWSLSLLCPALSGSHPHHLSPGQLLSFPTPPAQPSIACPPSSWDHNTHYVLPCLFNTGQSQAPRFPTQQSLSLVPRPVSPGQSLAHCTRSTSTLAAELAAGRLAQATLSQEALLHWNSCSQMLSGGPLGSQKVSP
jgi:hypothetical protein